MIKIKLNLRALGDNDLVSFAQVIKDKLIANATFPSPSPALPAFGTSIAAVQAAVQAHVQAQQTAMQRRTERENAVEALERDVESLASYVEMLSGGDAALIQSAGFDLRAPSTPLGDLPAPENVSATAGDNDGELDASWDAVRGARSYEVQTSPDPNTPAAWVHRVNTTRSSVTLAGLPSGTRCWVRVRALGAAGPGAWSDPAGKMVP
jgi:hypothetical protein